ncbi:MAG TPA: hypothetical protein VHY08_29580, partial [Bacillota bacterium]|nr:hypothetical protein [Bacillota bacterium]
YTPPGIGGYEKSNSEHYQFMTTEELLNGVYCLSAYGLATKDLLWMRRRRDIAVQLLQSMENRDHHLPGQRNGILKGESLQCGERGREITTYDALDPALKDTMGNLYIVVKTLGASLLLDAFFIQIGDHETANRAQEMVDKTVKAFEDFFDHHGHYLKANLYSKAESKVIAAIEPLAILIFLGLKVALHSYPKLMDLFRKHIVACLKVGAGIDTATGGLRLSSTSNNTWVSKVVLCEYVLRELFQIDLKSEYPGVFQELIRWARQSAAETTISDQIHSDTRRVVGASYYPRPITASIWVKSRL